MHCLVIDHRDSFTYNLVAIIRKLLGNDRVKISDHQGEILDLSVFTHFVLSPGPGSPQEVGHLTRKVLEFSEKSQTPLLGVCLGLQVVVSRFLGPDAVIKLKNGPSHGVVDDIYTEVGNFLFKGTMNPLKAVRYHSLVADETKFGPYSDLKVTARTKTGEIMALEHQAFPIYGVQFHPESLLTEQGGLIIRNFLGIEETQSSGGFMSANVPVDASAEATTELRIDATVRARELFFGLIYVKNDSCVWLQNERHIFLAGGRLGLGRPVMFAESAVSDGRFVAGFRTYEGDDFFLSFDRFLVYQGDKWQLYDSGEVKEVPDTDGASDQDPKYRSSSVALDFRLHESPEEYKAKIHQILEGPLLDGDSYEVCLTTEMQAELAMADSEPLAIAAWLEHLEQKPLPEYSGLFLNFPGGQTLVSFSPECFLSARNGVMKMRPMKGTRRRGVRPDAEVVAELKESKKDLRENLMILDLVRNDFNKISEATVTKAFEVNVLQHTIQMFSEVTARCPVNLRDAIEALFPAGSMTGAPKVRTMQLLRDLERRSRGVYSGICGFIWGDRVELGVVIRSIVLQADDDIARIVLSAGGAIVHGSDPSEEWQEVLVKFGKPLNVLQLVCARLSLHNLCSVPVDLGTGCRQKFVESFLVRLANDAARVYYVPAHFERMSRSGAPFATDAALKRQLDYLLNSKGVTSIRYVDDLIEPSATCQDLKLRIFWSTYNSSTEFSIENVLSIHYFSKLAVNDTAVFSFDTTLSRKIPMKFSKTVLLYNERREVTEGSWFNVAFFRDGRWMTPESRCGLLQGVYRKLLLDRGLIEEGIIYIHSLIEGEEIMCFNSVRGVWKSVLSL